MKQNKNTKDIILKNAIPMIAMMIIFLFTGCSDKPENLAKEYVQAWADNDVDKVIQMSEYRDANWINGMLVNCVVDKVDKNSPEDTKEFLDKLLSDQDFKNIMDNKNISDDEKNKKLRDIFISFVKKYPENYQGCFQELGSLGKIKLKNINILETTQATADNQDIRVELVFEDDSSEKTNIHLELINQQWKITNSPFITNQFKYNPLIEKVFLN